MSEKKGEPLAKTIARSGCCSRREAERLIQSGSVRVNGAVVTDLLTFITDQSIKVNNKLLNPREKTKLWLFHKPKGYLVSNGDPQKRKTIYDLLPPDLSRLAPIGRLDINTEGLLLLTNDGKLANFIAHPSTAWKRTYRIKVHGFWEKIDFSKCEKYGLKVDGIKYAPFKAVVEKESNTTNVWLKITLTEGKNREARKIMEYFHLTVMKLIRISFGSFNLGGLREGELKPVPDKVLKSVVGNKLPTLWAQN